MDGPRPRTTPREASAAGDPRSRLLAGLPVTERRLRLNGVATAILEGGEGPPVVLLHGPGGYALNWLRVIPGLVASHRVIAPDLPGHGASLSIEGPCDVKRVLDWLGALIECTCPEAPALVGQILGGAIATRFAAERGEALSRLVLVDTLGLVPFQPEPGFAKALSEYTARPTETTHDRLWSLCAFDLDTLREQLGARWEWIKAYNLEPAGTPALLATQHALMEQFGIPAIPRADLKRIAVPTTLVWGRHDLATPLSVAQAASADLAWPLRVIEDAADDPPLEQPEAFLKALRTALGEPNRGAGGKGDS